MNADQELNEFTSSQFDGSRNMLNRILKITFYRLSSS